MPAEDDFRFEAAKRQTEEQAWIALIAAGGDAGSTAMKALSGRYWRLFRGYLRKHGFADAEAADILQECWMDVARSAHTLDKSRVPEPWIWKILKFKMVDARREVERRFGRFTSANADELVEPIGDANTAASPDQVRSVRDRNECVDQAFLAFKQRYPNEAWWLRLVYFSEWDVKQVAQARGSSEAATRQFLSNARKLFRPFLLRCRDLLHT